MDELRFAWDPRKAAANLRKHGVSFLEAQTAFADDQALLIDDPEHSTTEERFVLLGMSLGQRLLVVVHGYGATDGLIRLVSARKATRPERTQYEEHQKP